MSHKLGSKGKANHRDRCPFDANTTRPKWIEKEASKWDTHIQALQRRFSKK